MFADFIRDVTKYQQSVRVNQEDLNTYNSLNKEHRATFDEIIDHVITLQQISPFVTNT